ncbi:MAG: hypothetical protein JO267_01705 [Alphaproteobacteria bacterium]|nr:hypothetical protein [Alphaproteobacteria bacterium]MBV9860842.1 hypothetical protein [Alphaproteobacteria bacterium]
MCFAHSIIWKLLRFALTSILVFSPLAGARAEYALSTLWSFAGGSGNDGAQPLAGLMFDSHGALYGTTLYGPNDNGTGTVFRLAPPTDGEGWTEAVLQGFTLAARESGLYPYAGLVSDASGNLYGTTSQGGTYTNCYNECGTVFMLTPPSAGTVWHETVLYEFTGADDGWYPQAGLTLGRDGALYGTASYGGNCTGYGSQGCGVVFRLAPPIYGGGSWTFSTLYVFQGGHDGAIPEGNLIFDSSGALYGTTFFGGFGFCCGTVFKLSPPTARAGSSWTETVLYHFRTSNDGQYPTAGLVFDTAGALYGTTVSGVSSNSNCGSSGCGTVFRLEPGPECAKPSAGVANCHLLIEQAPTPWHETVLYSFAGGSDGRAGPGSPGLVFDSAGALYGTTGYGGNAGCGGSGCGTVFKLTAPPTASGASWTETILHVFNGADGGLPQAGLIFDGSGALYGTTSGWGEYGYGTVFQLSAQASGQARRKLPVSEARFPGLAPLSGQSR